MLATELSRSGRLLMKLAGWCRQWNGTRVTTERVEGFGTGAEFIAHDVGPCPGDLRIVAATRPDATDLLGLHLAVLNIDQEGLVRTNPDVLRDLERVCGLCDSKRLCARDLADVPLHRRWREYCPNVLRINALAAQRGPIPEKHQYRGGCLPSYEMRAAKTRSHR